MKNSFIEQTARDYDMSYEDVQFIFTNNVDFYAGLEQFIKDRGNQ